MSIKNSEYEVDEKAVFSGYSNVYDVMDHAWFVVKLRNRHVNMVKGLDFILEDGCGTGLIMLELAKQGHKGRRIYGIDNNPKMLEKARKKLEGIENTFLFEGDAQELPFEDEYFDGITCNNLIYVVPYPKKIVSEIYRVLKPNGIVSIASARPGCNVNVLNDELDKHIEKNRIQIPKEEVNAFKASNEKIQKSLFKNLYEPYEMADILLKGGFSKILKKGTTYLDQCFYVLARK